ncbi:hypothetical protein G6F56_005843 [Rhizopus delemar]|nr:hypothetical protein G6F56_005843 [Rhizopus delemar]
MVMTLFFKKMAHPVILVDMLGDGKTRHVLKGKRIGKRRHQANHLEELEVIRHEEWVNLDQDIYVKLCRSIMEKYNAIKRALGGHTSGEAANAASTRRKNIDRVIGPKDIIARAFTGYKCDLIVREEKPEHEYADEYGVGETAVHNLNTKTIEEKGIKLPKVMKDMLDKLVTSNQNESKDLSVFGIQTAGLSITLLAADKPTPYITRITKIKDLSISSDISHFTRSILPLIILIWQFKQQILKVKNQVFSNQKRNYSKDTSEWLNACLNHGNVVVMPVTSTSTEYVNKRRKVDA